MIAVTSFSQQGYEVYGKKFLESAIRLETLEDRKPSLGEDQVYV